MAAEQNVTEVQPSLTAKFEGFVESLTDEESESFAAVVGIGEDVEGFLIPVRRKAYIIDWWANGTAPI